MYMSNYYLTIDDYDKYLALLGERLEKHGVAYDIVVSGGFAINRFYDGNRDSTHDCDFQFINPIDNEEDSPLLVLAAKIAQEHDLDRDWFNVCDYIVEGLTENLIHCSSYGALRIFIPNANALIASKTISFRDREGDSSADVQDLRSLFNYIGNVMSFEELLQNARSILPEAFRHLTERDIEELRCKFEIYFG